MTTKTMTKLTRIRPAAFLPVFLCLAESACTSGGDLNVGDDRSGEFGQVLEDYAGLWDGYAQAYAFRGDGTDRVRLTLDASGNGSLRFGEEELIGPATVVEALYPPLGPAQDPYDYGGGIRSGFAYPVAGATVDAARLQLSSDTETLMGSWCALAGPEPVPGYPCDMDTSPSTLSHGDGTCTFGPENTPVSCFIWRQCVFCDCDGATCSTVDKHQMRVDGALSDDGNTFEGTLQLGVPDGDRVTIVLTRQ